MSAGFAPRVFLPLAQKSKRSDHETAATRHNTNHAQKTHEQTQCATMSCSSSPVLRLSGARFRSPNAPWRPATCKPRVSRFARTSRAKRQRRADMSMKIRTPTAPIDPATLLVAAVLTASLLARRPGAGNCHGRRRGIRRGLVRLVLSWNLLILLLAVNVLLLAVLLAATSLALHLPAFAAGSSHES